MTIYKCTTGCRINEIVPRGQKGSFAIVQYDPFVLFSFAWRNKSHPSSEQDPVLSLAASGPGGTGGTTDMDMNLQLPLHVPQD